MLFLGQFRPKAIYDIQTIQGQLWSNYIQTKYITLWHYVHGLYDITRMNVEGQYFQTSDE